MPVVGICGIPKKKTIFVISENLINSLDEEELKTTILHELFHIRIGDVETRTLALSHRKIFHPQYLKFFIYFAVVTLGWLFLFVSIFSVRPSMGSSFMFIPILIDVVIPIFLGVAVIASIFMLLSLWKGGIWSANYLYIHELLADGFSATYSMKPRKLRSAILKTSGLKQVPVFSKKSLSSFSQIINSKLLGPNEIKYIKELLMLKQTHPRLNDYTLDNLEYRFYFIELVENLITKKVKLIILKPHFKRLRRNCPKPVTDYIKSHKEKFNEFLKYSVKNANHFNLIACAEYLGVEPHNVLHFIWGAVYTGLIDLKLIYKNSNLQ